MKRRGPIPFAVEYEASFFAAGAGLGLSADQLAAAWRGMAVYFNPLLVARLGRIALGDRLVEDLGWDFEDVDFALIACSREMGISPRRICECPSTLREFIDLLITWKNSVA